MSKILIAAFLFTLMPLLAFAAEPVDWGLGLQEAASPVKEQMEWFHNDLLMPIITGITIFVFILLLIVVVRFNRHVNKTPSQTTHNVPLEILWTIVPVIILVVIAVPSFKLLYYTDKVANPEMTLNVTGYQWHWGFEYPDYEIEEFKSYMIADENIDKSKGQKRLLSTDNIVVLPTETDIEILVTAGDVLHSFAMPAFGIKTDAVPGRINHTWVRINKPGTYYGQCSEICGKNHAFMPAEIRAVEKSVFEEWAKIAKDDLEASYAFLETGINTTAISEQVAPQNIINIADQSGE